MTVFQVRLVSDDSQVANTCEMQDIFSDPHANQQNNTKQTLSKQKTSHSYDSLSGFHFSKNTIHILPDQRQTITQKEELEWEDHPVNFLHNPPSTSKREFFWTSESSHEMDSELVQFASILVDISKQPPRSPFPYAAQPTQRSSFKQIPSKSEYQELPRSDVRIPNSCEYHKKKHQKVCDFHGHHSC